MRVLPRFLTAAGLTLLSLLLLLAAQALVAPGLAAPRQTPSGTFIIRTSPLDPNHSDYELLAPIVEAILDQAGGFESFAKDIPRLIRQAIDELIDTPRTNRFLLMDTEKTEKTYLGTKIEIPGHEVFMQEKVLRGSMMGSNQFRLDMPRFVDLYLDGKLLLDEMVSHRITLDEINHGYDLMRRREATRTVITFD